MTSLAALGRFVRRSSKSEAGVCTRCGAELEDQHRHVADLDAQRLLCSCCDCLAAITQGETSERYRAIPQQVRHAPRCVLSSAEWDALGVPVRLAFFVWFSRPARWLAVLPGPAGATEVDLPGVAWAQFLRARPELRVSPDVEALLVRQVARGPSAAYVAPIDLCYELVGLLRRHWRGFDGGDEARAVLDRFFARLELRARQAAASEVA